MKSDNNQLILGEECCSQYSISFHYIESILAYEMYSYLYFCPKTIQETYYQLKGKEYYEKELQQKLFVNEEKKKLYA